jgi:Cupredoxin-like domain
MPVPSYRRARRASLALPLLCFIAPLGAAPADGELHLRSARDPYGVQRAPLTLDSYSFRPEHLVVQARRAVELTLRNVATLVPHNFVLDDPRSGLAIHQDVGAGESAVVRFTPMVRGTFVFYCDKRLLFLPSHRERGMEGRLEVR